MFEKKKLAGSILVTSAFLRECNARFEKLVTDKEPIKLSHWACHCISNLRSGKRFASVESDKQFINLLLLIGDHMNYGQRPCVKNIGHFRIPLAQIGITESGKLQLGILLKNKLIIETNLTAVEVKDRFQTLLSINYGIWETFPIQINNTDSEVGHINFRHIVAIENRINQVCLVSS